jgi:hypothetical protein
MNHYLSGPAAALTDPSAPAHALMQLDIVTEDGLLLAAGLLEAQAPERCPVCGEEPVGSEAYCWDCWCDGFGWPEHA